MVSQLATRRGVVATAAEALALGPQPDPASEVKRLEIILHAATEEQAMEAIAFMFKVLPMENAGETDAEKDEIVEINIAAYKLAVQGYPRWAIMEARNAFIAGKVEGYTSSFAPRPPDLGREIARRCDEMHAKLIRMRRQADENRQYAKEERTGPRSPELKAMGEKRVAELRASADAKRHSMSKREPEWVEENPITPEALAAAGIPDAKPRGSSFDTLPVPDHFADLARRRA